MTQKAKRYPDKTLETEWQRRGLRYTVGWEIPGPKNTGVAWMVGYGLNGRVVIVQTFIDGGWEAYTASGSLNVAVTIDDVMMRCGLD